jgi:4'-phosphopantetheinyl transferase EntD
LASFLKERLPEGCIGDVRAILPGDERLLRPIELQGLEAATVSVRRASGAGRDLARRLCHQLEYAVDAIPRSPHRSPVWPIGLVGSISHDAEFVAAAVGLSNAVKGLGIDIEPLQQLPAGVMEMIGTKRELEALGGLEFCDKVLFCIKEAVFKAVYPRDSIFLDFNDVTVSVKPEVAKTTYGRTVNWRVATTRRVLAIAWW